MASQSLYRKHRPQRFAELVGQEHVSLALRNAVTDERVGHAYLFSGPRGTGKTTTARLLAKALNCTNLGADGEPCRTCDNCTAIAAGTFSDLVELDAASHRGIDATRALVQSVHLGIGPHSRRKVYVIDEVHMLTTDASNVLLKTLEEPPAHVVFVLATTDPEKVLPTIRSRTQHFEFPLLTRERIVAHLADVLAREDVTAEPEVLDLVARRAAGSVRDALSLLDQALAIGGGSLDAESVRTALGGAPFERRLEVLRAAAAEDVAGALAALHEVLAQGHDTRRVADDLLRTMRDAFMIVNAGDRVPYDGPEEEADALRELARGMGNAAIVRAIELLGQAIVDIRAQTVADPRLVLEVAVVRVARRDARSTVDTLLERVERLERRISGDDAAAPVVPTRRVEAGAAGADAKSAPSPGGAGPVVRPRPASSPPEPAEPPRSPDPPRAAAAPPAGDESAGDESAGDQPGAREEPPAGAPAATVDLDSVIEAWPAVLGALKPPLAATIQEAQPIGLEGGVIVFGVPPRRVDATNKRFRSEAATIKQAFASQLGFEPRFQLRPHDFDAPGALRPDAVAAAAVVARDDGEDAIDLSALVDVEDAPPTDTVSRVVADLGAEVVEERPRE